MTECSGCGSCCNPVSLPFSQRQVQMMVPGRDIDARTHAWVLHELEPISRREGLAMRPDLRDRGAVTLVGGQLSADYSHFYRCIHYDADTRRCTDYDNRPGVCRAYPLYGRDKPAEGSCLPPTCSYRADLGQEVVEWQPVAMSRRQGDRIDL